MKNRRNGGDRRSFGRTVSSPLTDESGSCLHLCRSRAPDRRLNNLEVEWISVALVHDKLIKERKIDPAGMILKAEPRAKRVKG